MSSANGDQHQIICEAAGQGPETRNGPVAHSSRLEGKEQRIEKEAKQQGRRLIPLLFKNSSSQRPTVPQRGLRSRRCQAERTIRGRSCIAADGIVFSRASRVGLW